MLKATDLWKSYYGKDVVRGVNCGVEGGEVLGFLGPNGAGKTTTVGMLYGAVMPAKGSVRFFDYTIPQQAREARFHMGIVTQDDSLDPDFSVRDNLIVFSRYYGITGKAAAKRADELIEKVELGEHIKHRPDELSGGMRRRLVLARALINNPRLIFLDEPTTGLDPESRQAFWKLVIQLRKEGCGIILTTHYMDEAQRLSDRLILMQQGQIVDEGKPEPLIEKVVGKEIAEIEGVDAEILERLARDADNAWIRPFGSGHLLSVPEAHRQTILANLDKMNATSITIRKANLEDVFLRLTGDKLD